MSLGQAGAAIAAPALSFCGAGNAATALQPKRGTRRIVMVGSGICRGGSAMRALVRLLGIFTVLVVFAVGPAVAQTSDADQGGDPPSHPIPDGGIPEG